MRFVKLLGLAPLQIAQALVGFGAIAAFTRLMSGQDFGRYALALSVSMFAYTLVFTWAEAAAYRFYAAARAEKRLADHFATLIVLAGVLGAGALIATAGALLLFGVRGDIAALSVFAAGSSVFRFLTKLSRETERASFAFGRYALAETAYLTLGFSAGIALLMIAHLGPIAPFAGLMLAGAIVFLFDASKFAKRAENGAATLSRTGSYAVYGAPLALAIAVDLGVQAIARILIAAKAGEGALGAYAAAFGLARPLDLMFMSAGAALTPALLAAFEDRGVEAAQREARKLFTTLAALTLPACVGLMLLAQPLTQLMVGANLSAASGQALPWLALAGVFAGFNLYYWSEAFQLARRTHERALIMLAPGALQIVLTLLLAPTHGATGAAIAALCAAGAGTALLIGIGRSRLALPVALGDLARILTASALMATSVMLWPTQATFVGLGSHAFIGAIVYGAALLALDFSGARTRASALLQSFSGKLVGLGHLSFTDRPNVRAR